MKFTFAEQLKEARREVAMRKSVYPRWIAARRMTETKAAEQIALMEAIAATLEPLAEQEQEQIAPSLFANQ